LKVRWIFVTKLIRVGFNVKLPTMQVIIVWIVTRHKRVHRSKYLSDRTMRQFIR